MNFEAFELKELGRKIGSWRHEPRERGCTLNYGKEYSFNFLRHFFTQFKLISFED